MGYDYTQIKDFIEEKGLAEYSHDLFADALNNPKYNNKLFVKEEQLESSFLYYDPNNLS